MKLQGIHNKGTSPRFSQGTRRVKSALKVCAVAAGFALFSVPAQAFPTFFATMLGSSEVPPNTSPATGFTKVVVTGNNMSVNVTWSGLIGGTPAAAHIHCCVAPGSNVGVAVGFPAFPITTSGAYSHIFNLLDPAIYTAAFRTNFGGGTAAGSKTALITGLFAGRAYSNIHNATFGGGEIRGLLTVPEPSSMALFGSGLLGLLFARRKNKGR
jgi:hypothetical protein